MVNFSFLYKFYTKIHNQTRAQTGSFKNFWLKNSFGGK